MCMKIKALLVHVLPRSIVPVVTKEEEILKLYDNNIGKLDRVLSNGHQ
jgi:hypothetical protein